MIRKALVLTSALIGALMVFSAFCNTCVSAASAQTGSSSSAPYAVGSNGMIQHIVIIDQENHAFDNLFSAFPGLPAGFNLASEICQPFNGKSYCPWNADNSVSLVQGSDIPHTRSAALHAYDGGKMNGFVTSNNLKNGVPYSMAYYTGSAIPYYWDYASYFTIDYDFMSSSMSYSLPNHIFAVASQAGNYASTCMSVCATTYDLTFPQIGQSLTNAGLSWGYYQQNWNDALNCPYSNPSYFGPEPYTRSYLNAHVHGTGGWDGLWSGLTEFVQVQQNSVECKSLGNLKDLQAAITNNNLPAVSWVNPAPQNSDHPGQTQGKFTYGEDYVSSIINLIEKSPEWSSTVIFLTWDDYGGYYDSVTPTQLDFAGQGFRVPLIAISPYSKPGALVQAPAYTFSAPGRTIQNINQEDFSAFLTTIEDNWNLVPLSDQNNGVNCQTVPSTADNGHCARDGYGEPNLFFMLNFSQAPLNPLFLSPSGVTYPLSSCSPSSCSSTSGMYMPTTIYTSNAPIGENLSQALADSGNSDPGD